MNEVKEEALAKLAKEWNESGGIGGQYRAVNGPVYNMIRGFVKQDEEFARLVLASDKTVSDVLKGVHGSVQSGWSDFAVYTRAIGVYCPGAKISIYMELDLTGDGANGVAFGRDGEVTQDVYGKVDMPRNAATKKAEQAKAEKPAKAEKTAKGKKNEKTDKQAKVLPPPDVSGDTPKTGTSAKTEEEKKIIRFNFMDML